MRLRFVSQIQDVGANEPPVTGTLREGACDEFATSDNTRSHPISRALIILGRLSGSSSFQYLRCLSSGYVVDYPCRGQWLWP